MTIQSVPLLDLDAQYAPIRDQVLKAIEEVVDSKQFILGKKVAAFEAEVAQYIGAKYAIGVSSGTDALILALMALDIGPGDEVITSPFTFFATAGSIARVGARPVFVDIDSKTYNINPNLIEQKITSKTKAIMPVHLFGQLADMDQIMAIAKKHHLYVIEDAAQAIGSAYTTPQGEKQAGTIGDIGCFSFFPSKNLGCAGDAGLVTTNNPELADKLTILRVHGSKPKYYHKIIGGNFRIDTIQAVVLSVKLPYLESQHEARQKHGQYYTEYLKDLVGVPYVKPNHKMIYNQYTIRLQKRDELQAYLDNAKIGNAIYYPVPLHVQECFNYLGYREGDCPQSELAAKEVLSIPIYAELIQEQQDYVIAKIRDFVRA